MKSKRFGNSVNSGEAGTDSSSPDSCEGLLINAINICHNECPVWREWFMDDGTETIRGHQAFINDFSQTPGNTREGMGILILSRQEFQNISSKQKRYHRASYNDRP